MFKVGQRVYSSTGQSGVIEMDARGLVVKMVYGTGQNGQEICSYAMNPSPLVWRDEPWYEVDDALKKRIVYAMDKALLESLGVTGLKAWEHLQNFERMGIELPVALTDPNVVGYKSLREAMIASVKQTLDV